MSPARFEGPRHNTDDLPAQPGAAARVISAVAEWRPKNAAARVARMLCRFGLDTASLPTLALHRADPDAAGDRDTIDAELTESGRPTRTVIAPRRWRAPWSRPRSPGETMRPMGNQRIEGHPLIGTEHVYRPDHEPHDPAKHTEPGTLVIGNGHHVEVLAVFRNWNDVDGLDMLHVRCRETREPTHVTPADLNLPPLG